MSASLDSLRRLTLVCRPHSKANRAGTRGFRAPEVLLKCGDQTGGEVLRCLINKINLIVCYSCGCLGCRNDIAVLSHQEISFIPVQRRYRGIDGNRDNHWQEEHGTDGVSAQ